MLSVGGLYQSAMTTRSTKSTLDHRLGIVLMVFSALVYSTAGLFTKWVSAQAWDVVFWRGLFAALLTILLIIGRKRVRSEFADMGTPGIVAAFLMASGTPAFIAAFKMTDVANVALIYAAIPMVAAAIAWIWFRETIGRWTVIGCGLAFLGVVMIVGGSFGGLNLYGDLLAGWMTLMMAAVIVLYRRFPNTPGTGAMVLSSILLLPLAAYLGAPMQTAPIEIGILMAFGLVFALASVTMNEGAKRLPSGQAGLLSTLEAPLAPIWAFFLLSEVPVWATALGGTVILVGVVIGQRAGSR